LPRFSIGQSVSREEDPRLLRGEGRYIDDLSFPRIAHGVVLRSTHAHARIRSIDTAAAISAPGVLAVLTAADHDADGLHPTRPVIPRKRKDGSPAYVTEVGALAKSEVKYVGDGVAFVVAETLAQAKDAAERIEIEYEPLPVIVSTVRANDPDAPLVWVDCPDNEAVFVAAGDKDGTQAAIANAAHVVRQRFVINRVTANSMETRGAVGIYDKHEDRYVLYCGIQGPHMIRELLASQVFRLPEHRFRVITNDMGGGFGMKGGYYPEQALVLWAAKKTGRPVKWIAERNEGLMTDCQARDNVSDAELALDENGKFLGLRVKTLANIGAYFTTDRNILGAVTHYGVLSGTYTTPAIYTEIACVYTNKPPTAPYRGAGRPEAAYIIERMIELAARKLGTSSVELRRRNTIPAEAIPYETGFVYTYDSGEFEKNLDSALGAADYAGFESRRAKAKARGKLRGIGVSNTIEQAQGQPSEGAEIRFDPSGTVTMLIGTIDSGQGHGTSYKQILSQKLGIDADLIRFVDGDTDEVAFGRGSFGSRSMMMGGTVLAIAADKVIEKCRRITAHVLEAAETDIEFADGMFTVAGTDKSMDIVDVAKTAFQPAKLPPGMEPCLIESAIYTTPAPTYPNGCHVVEVEIDPETGVTELIRYTVIDDCGTVINPKLLKGQIHGGIAQGAGQILMEDYAVDEETGQVLAGSFLDYCMPRADDLCSFEVSSNEVATPVNPLGAKGGGEAGVVGSMPAVTNAIVDALSPYGIAHVPMPATSERVWRLINGEDVR
jgi:carbon-monoxide dehydrogenase large subunit